MIWCVNPPEFQPGNRVVSLVFHPPEVQPGTRGTIVSPRTGDLYAVQLPSGELHRWFAGFELERVYFYPGYVDLLTPGSYAKILTTEGHPKHIREGMIVKIVKALGQVNYYDLTIEGHGYHRWLAEFEIADLGVVLAYPP